jgi:hypothetical protein
MDMTVVNSWNEWDPARAIACIRSAAAFIAVPQTSAARVRSSLTFQAGSGSKLNEAWRHGKFLDRIYKIDKIRFQKKGVRLGSNFCFLFIQELEHRLKKPSGELGIVTSGYHALSC